MTRNGMRTANFCPRCSTITPSPRRLPAWSNTRYPSGSSTTCNFGHLTKPPVAAIAERIHRQPGSCRQRPRALNLHHQLVLFPANRVADQSHIRLTLLWLKVLGQLGRAGRCIRTQRYWRFLRRKPHLRACLKKFILPQERLQPGRAILVLGSMRLERPLLGRQILHPFHAPACQTRPPRRRAQCSLRMKSERLRPMLMVNQVMMDLRAAGRVLSPTMPPAKTAANSDGPGDDPPGAKQISGWDETQSQHGQDPASPLPPCKPLPVGAHSRMAPRSPSSVGPRRPVPHSNVAAKSPVRPRRGTLKRSRAPGLTPSPALLPAPLAADQPHPFNGGRLPDRVFPIHQKRLLIIVPIGEKHDVHRKTRARPLPAPLRRTPAPHHPDAAPSPSPGHAAQTSPAPNPPPVPPPPTARSPPPKTRTNSILRASYSLIPPPTPRAKVSHDLIW